MSEYDFQTFGNPKPKKLIIFLHGYNSCGQDIYPYAQMLSDKLNDALIVVPEADMISEKNPLKKQWYALLDVDPDKRRRLPEVSINEIISIYNKTGKRISAEAKRINRFMTQMQRLYKIANKQTYIMGFSQGAMLAIYSGLTRNYQIGGVFPFAGIVCGKDTLEKEIVSHPEVYLFHGTDDRAVQYKTLSFTKSWLDAHDISWEAIEYDGIEHKLIEEEMSDAAEIIQRSA